MTKTGFIYKVEITIEKVGLKHRATITVYCLDIVRYEIHDFVTEKFDKSITVISDTDKNYMEQLKPIVEDSISIYDNLFKNAIL